MCVCGLLLTVGKKLPSRTQVTCYIFLVWEGRNGKEASSRFNTGPEVANDRCGELALWLCEREGQWRGSVPPWGPPFAFKKNTQKKTVVLISCEGISALSLSLLREKALPFPLVAAIPLLLLLSLSFSLKCFHSPFILWRVSCFCTRGFFLFLFWFASLFFH